MKFAFSLILFTALVPAVAPRVVAQNRSAAQAVDDLHLQLLDVQGKETELQERARQLDEDLKPANIERALAGVGSTRPEELRESRRRQLTIERDSVRAQLKLVGTSRERLETVIRTAETQAYQQSAAATTAPVDQIGGASYAGSHRWLFGIAGLIAILGIGLVVTAIRRLSV